MKFLTALFGKKASAPAAVPEPEVTLSPEDAIAALPGAKGGANQSGAINIWDMDDDDDQASKPAASRRRRNATRLIGFDNSEGDVVDLFQEADEDEAQNTSLFPVGWLSVIEGEGRGHSFALTAGMNQIGRGADNAITLDFGDAAISRDNHAAVVFDEENNSFVLGHGGKSNVVRLNGKPVISNETLEDGAKIKIGETVLMLKTLCGPDFSWAAGDNEEHDDVAIA